MIIKRDVHGKWQSQDDFRSEGGLKSFIGWSRLSHRLKECGEIAENETIVQFDVSPDGIQYTLEIE